MIDMTASVSLTAVKAAEKFNDYCKNDSPSLNKFLWLKFVIEYSLCNLTGPPLYRRVAKEGVAK